MEFEIRRANTSSTIEWFGGSTYRLTLRGITIFLDSLLNRPSNLHTALYLDQVDKCDYICISNALLDHLPGADQLAKKFGATIIANPEAIRLMINAGVSPKKLVQVTGGERVPLYTKAQREGLGWPEFTLDPSTAPLFVEVWPSLHCFEHPRHDYGLPNPTSTMKTYDHGLSVYARSLAMIELRGNANRPYWDTKESLAFREDGKNKHSTSSGGQMMYNFILADRVILWMSSLGGYESILRSLKPKPDLAIIGIAGHGNLNGQRYRGSTAEFATDIVKWIGEPTQVIWCSQDQRVSPSTRVDTWAASTMVKQKTASAMVKVVPGVIYSCAP